MKNMSAEIVRQRIEEVAALEDWNVTRLAKAAGIDQGGLSRFVRGRMGLRFSTLCALWPYLWGDKCPLGNESAGDTSVSAA